MTVRSGQTCDAHICSYFNFQSVFNGMHVIFIPYALMKIDPASWMKMVTKFKGSLVMVMALISLSLCIITHQNIMLCKIISHILSHCQLLAKGDPISHKLIVILLKLLCSKMHHIEESIWIGNDPTWLALLDLVLADFS